MKPVSRDAHMMKVIARTRANLANPGRLACSLVSGFGMGQDGSMPFDDIMNCWPLEAYLLRVPAGLQSGPGTRYVTTGVGSNPPAPLTGSAMRGPWPGRRTRS